jgi:hypothetical protein
MGANVIGIFIILNLKMLFFSGKFLFIFFLIMDKSKVESVLRISDFNSSISYHCYLVKLVEIPRFARNDRLIRVLVVGWGWSRQRALSGPTPTNYCIAK